METEITVRHILNLIALTLLYYVLFTILSSFFSAIVVTLALFLLLALVLFVGYRRQRRYAAATPVCSLAMLDTSLPPEEPHEAPATSTPEDEPPHKEDS